MHQPLLAWQAHPNPFLGAILDENQVLSKGLGLINCDNRNREEFSRLCHAERAADLARSLTTRLPGFGEVRAKHLWHLSWPLVARDASRAPRGKASVLADDGRSPSAARSA